MEYTIKKLGLMAGITTRTLRHFDEIGLLKPAKINSSGYRIYGQKEVDQLQQILFYRQLGFKLERIREIINAPTFDETKALREHREELVQKREQLDLLIVNINKTLALKEGRIIMSDQEKFEGFKQKLLADNEKKYGQEIREKYSDETVDKSNQRMQAMSQEQFAEVTRLTNEITETLEAALKTGNPAGELAQKAADLHRQWLSYFWGKYSPEAHIGVAQMYVDDPRFTAYYDANQPGTAEFLREAILIYAESKS
ncbi:MAG: MerR family transcriptional regulator [Syntrophomonas sp.]|nr:MerR family transcriptional regulator [Syntrophomonas sp.]